MPEPSIEAASPPPGRAYVYVDRGQACVGNAWLERTWSGFLGHTTGLIHKSSGAEWLLARNAEFSVELNGQGLGVGDFGEVVWSETQNALGAVLVATHVRPGLEVAISSTALHEAPAIVRSVCVTNTNPHPAAVGPVTTESFALEREGVQFYGPDLDRIRGTVELSHVDAVAALDVGGEGLLIAHSGGSTLDLAATHPGVCSVRVTEQRTLERAGRWILEPVFLVAFSGDRRAAVDTLLPDLEKRVRAHQALEEARAKEAD